MPGGRFGALGAGAAGLAGLGSRGLGRRRRRRGPPCPMLQGCQAQLSPMHHPDVLCSIMQVPQNSHPGQEVARSWVSFEGAVRAC